MPRTSETKITCGLKGCGKIFHIPDPPEKATEGVEAVASIQLASGFQEWFCGMRHLLKWGVEYLKAEDAPRPKTQMNDAQLETLKQMGIIVAAPESNAHKAVEELETIPQIENFDLRD